MERSFVSCNFAFRRILTSYIPKMNTDILKRYFPSLTDVQISRFAALEGLYTDWNAKINVISRKDIDNLFERHILHSLAIAAFLGSVAPNTSFVDVGTGGGFPGIPLAIFYPEAKFHLVDRIAKKLNVAREVSAAIGLSNITIQHGDMGECHTRFDYVVSRAVMRLDSLVKIVRRNIDPTCRNTYANGLICLKGGNIADESKGISFPVIEYPVNEYLDGDFFDTKKVVYVPMAHKK